MLPLLVLLASTVRGPGDVESLTRAADAVVHGKVLSTASELRNGQIFTTVRLATLETWKGPQLAEVKLLVPGGNAGELSQTVSGMATFATGEEVVVFLNERVPGIYSIYKLALGKFAIGGGLALRDRRGLECVGCGASETDSLPLGELKARVLRSAAR